jgi:hypothetical protein
VAETITVSITQTSSATTTLQVITTSMPTVTTTTVAFTTLASGVQTVTSTATVTSTTIFTPPCGPTPTFAVQIAPGPASGAYGGLYLSEALGNTGVGLYGLYPQAGLLNAQRFYLDAGVLFDTNGRHFVSTGSPGQQVILASNTDANNQGLGPATTCSNVGGQLTCVNGASNMFWITDYGNLDVYKLLIWGPQSDDEYYQVAGGVTTSNSSPTLALNIVPLCI